MVIAPLRLVIHFLDHGLSLSYAAAILNTPTLLNRIALPLIIPFRPDA